MSHDHVPSAEPRTIDPARGRTLVGAAGALFAVGAAMSIAAAATDAHRFAFSYLTGFVFIATIGLGALFFVILQHLTASGWSVIPRRAMEWVTGLLPASLVLFIPVALSAKATYYRWMGAEAALDEALQKKTVWLNRSFFLGRGAFFLLIWSALALWFYGTSRRQDTTGEAKLTLRMQATSAPAMLVFGITLTLAAFDWLMSLDPHWYSTIFGVYVFSGSVVSALSALALITIALEASGLTKGISTVEHRHDIGKLLFGFIVFWGYIGFSQFFLIWYANIPEETIYFRDRWEGSWKAISLVLILGHFLIPFLALLPRRAKRSALVLGVMSGFMLVMHYVDLYWMVMPNLDEGTAHLTWLDAAGLLAPLGFGALVLAVYATRSPLFPTRDPRLPESLRFENT